MTLDWPTFVLQRRINHPLGAVEHVLCDPQLLRAGMVVPLPDDAAYVRLEGSFGVTFPPFGLEGTSWWAPASVCTRRGRRLVRFELEINAWDPTSTELLVRPRARHPYRWGGHRLRQYFRVAHATADAFTHLLAAGAVSSSWPKQPVAPTGNRGCYAPVYTLPGADEFEGELAWPLRAWRILR